MRFAIAYLKVKELKDGSLEFDGPVIGPVVPSRDEAEQRARTIVQNHRNMAIMPKIYVVRDDYTIEEVLHMCQPHFALLKRNIIESKQITDRPIKKSK